MEKFSVFVNNVDSLVWSMVLVVIMSRCGIVSFNQTEIPTDSTDERNDSSFNG